MRCAQLLYRCPWVHHVDKQLNASCVPWAVATLRNIYAHYLLIDQSNSLFAGTPAASNLYVRSALGPRAYFSRLRALTSRHLAGMMSIDYDVVRRQ